MGFKEGIYMISTNYTSLNSWRPNLEYVTPTLYLQIVGGSEHTLLAKLTFAQELHGNLLFLATYHQTVIFNI